MFLLIALFILTSLKILFLILLRLLNSIFQSFQVRWADIEERKKQDRFRTQGFIVGQNWEQVMDPKYPERALAKTKYF